MLFRPLWVGFLISGWKFFTFWWIYIVFLKETNVNEANMTRKNANFAFGHPEMRKPICTCAMTIIFGMLPGIHVIKKTCVQILLKLILRRVLGREIKKYQLLGKMSTSVKPYCNLPRVFGGFCSKIDDFFTKIDVTFCSRGVRRSSWAFLNVKNYVWPAGSTFHGVWDM